MKKGSIFKHFFVLLAAVALLGSSTGAVAIPVAAPASTLGSGRQLIPCGTPFGIKLFTNGVMVVGTADLETAGGIVNPAKIADVRVGDIILAVDGKTVVQNQQVSHAILNCSGRSLQLQIDRHGEKRVARLSPVLSTGCYKAGLWVRDSAAGVGTLTYYDPQSRVFAGLGHGITDPDTNEILPLRSGDIVPVTISGIHRGLQGTPGELQGYFASDVPEGTLYANSEQGVFGKMNRVPPGKPLPVCQAGQVKTGPVQILCTVDASGPQAYQAEIELLNTRTAQTKNMVVHITDPKLLKKTGGIVQGMSGSPILQNGKLVGAVTHVFVNDPTRGYGILAEQMLAGEEKTDIKPASSLFFSLICPQLKK